MAQEIAGTGSTDTEPLPVDYPWHAYFPFALPIPLAFAAAFLLTRLYRWAVLRAMRSGRDRGAGAPPAVAAEPACGTDRPEIPGLAIEIVGPGSPRIPVHGGDTLEAAGRRQRRWLAGIYTAAGLVHAASTTLIWLSFVEGLELFPKRVAVVLLFCLWPLLVTLAMLTFPRVRLSFMGPLVLGFFISAGGIWFLHSAALLASGGRWNVFTLLILGGAALIELGVPLVLASAYLVWAARRHVRTRTSGQMAAIDAVWLVATMLVLLPALFTYLPDPPHAARCLALLLPYLAYRLVLRAGFAVRARIGRVESPRTLLLLRVFRASRRSTRLLRSLEHDWRNIGPITLIAGEDLAAATLDADEFLDFLSGRLRRRLVGDHASLERRFRSRRSDPDLDGRYRIQEFLCSDVTWKDAFHRLAAEADAVLMDLRGFSPSNQGCLYEIAQLVDRVPASRIVLLEDEETDVTFLHESLQTLWQEMAPSSPNATGGAGTLRVLRSGRRTGREQRTLAGLLRGAAGSGDEPPTAPSRRSRRQRQSPS